MPSGLLRRHQLNLKSAFDLVLVKVMVAKADGFVQNLAPGAAQRMGLSSAQLAKVHPRIITVNIVGYGQHTDCRDMRAYAKNQARVCGMKQNLLGQVPRVFDYRCVSPLIAGQRFRVLSNAEGPVIVMQME